MPNSLAPRKDGFGADEGSSLRKSYEGILKEIGEEGQHHVQVAENIRKMVIQPFGKWTAEHKERVDYSYDLLKGKVKVYEKDGQDAQKVQNRYFNKCRLYDIAKQEEEMQKLEEEARNDLKPSSTASDADPPTADQAPASPPAATISISSTGTTGSEPKSTTATSEAATTTTAADEEDEEEIELAEVPYTKIMLRKLLSNMLAEIHQKDVKISILGTYDHVSTGSDIVEWLTKNVTSGSLPTAEKLGQDLIQNGFLRQVGAVGNKFANSSVFNYQWKKQAFVVAGLEQEQKPANDLISTMAGDYLPGALSNYLNNPNPNETPVEKLSREVNELDQKTREAINKYDTSRTTLEEAIVRHLSYMERCETDRLKAIKVVLLDFTASISNKVAGLKATLEKCLLYQESIVPERDMRYLIEEYKTGFFAPKAPLYDNYYNPAEGWTYGGDLEVRARGDNKRMPLIVSTILRYLDSQYPMLQNDEVRLGVWTVDVPLEETHKLRRALNNGLPVSTETLKTFKAPIVANALKLYLLELPDSLVPSRSYDAIKTLYNEHGGAEYTSKRLREVQAVLQPLKLSSIATIDAVAKHLERLMLIAKPPEEYRVSLAQELGGLFLRPRAQSSVTMSDRHPYLLARDLLEHRSAIFDELRRQNSATSRRTSSLSISGGGGMSGALHRKVASTSTSAFSRTSSASSASASSSGAATGNAGEPPQNASNRVASFRFNESTAFHVKPLAATQQSSSASSSSGTSRIQFDAVPTADSKGSAGGAGKEVEVIDVDDDDEVQVVSPPKSTA